VAAYTRHVTALPWASDYFFHGSSLRHQTATSSSWWSRRCWSTTVYSSGKALLISQLASVSRGRSTICHAPVDAGDSSYSSAPSRSYETWSVDCNSTDAEDGSWLSDKDVEPPAMMLTLSADQPVYDNGVLKVNISWSAAGQSLFTPLTDRSSNYVFSLHSICQRNTQYKINNVKRTKS